MPNVVDDTMTIGRLRELLNSITVNNDNLPVYTEGCDCTGHLNAVLLEHNQLYLSRTCISARTLIQGGFVERFDLDNNLGVDM